MLCLKSLSAKHHSVASLFVKCQILASGNSSVCAVCIWCLCLSVCVSLCVCVCVGREAVWCESDPNPGWFLSHVCGTHPDGSIGLRKCHSDNETTGPAEIQVAGLWFALLYTHTHTLKEIKWKIRDHCNGITTATATANSQATNLEATVLKKICPQAQRHMNVCLLQ